MVIGRRCWQSGKCFAVLQNLTPLYLLSYPPKPDQKNSIKRNLRVESFYNDALDTLGLSEDHLLEPPEALEAKHNTLKNAANWD